jgi:protein-S-isoprenylcysteine O-methyltransferase Ste14
MKNKEGKVKDLVEKLQVGELTPKEIRKILKERGLSDEASWKGSIFGFLLYAAYFTLCFPLNIVFSTQLPEIHFPVIVIYISIILVAIGTFIMGWITYSHRKKGGLKNSDVTIIFYRDGLYSIMRHPGVFGLTMWFICLPIILSILGLPFTILSVVAIIIVVAFHYYGTLVEERFNIKKWDDEYRQYMKEVPRFNFIKGLWNLRKIGGRL